VQRTKAANPGMQLKDVLRKAGQTYKKDASASSTKTHKKHGGLISLPLFGGRKRRGGQVQAGEAGEAVSEERTQPQVAAVSGQAGTQSDEARTQPAAGESDNNVIQAGGGPLSPADVKSSGTALQLNAAQYSGGKKSRRKSKSKSKSKSRSRSRSRRHRK